MKKKEIDTLKFHKDLIEQRKREALLRQIREQEQDAENIERVKEEYVPVWLVIWGFLWCKISEDLPFKQEF